MPGNIYFVKSVKKYMFFPLVFLSDYPSFSTDLLHDHSLYMLIICSSSEFVSGDTLEIQWDCISLYCNVQIYQILLAVINLQKKYSVHSYRENEGSRVLIPIPSTTVPATKGH